MHNETTLSRLALVRKALLVVGLSLLLLGAASAIGDGPGEMPSVASAHGDHGNGTYHAEDGSTHVSEQRYVEEAPEEGDEYFEAEADDGSWISYTNPRDRYRDPMVGNASGKICVTLRNEAGEVVVGESVPNTSVVIPTPTLPWHSHADPMVVELPMTEHYDRPLDSDQFGTSDDLPQGDGYMDAHCIEYHGPPDDKTIEYGKAIVDGEHADRIEVVGYIQQAHEAWDTDVDAIEDAVSYEEAGGEWTMETGKSHGQVTVVLQLDAVEQNASTGDGDRNQTNATATATSTPTDPVTTTEDEGTTVDDRGTEGSTGPLDQTAPGVGAALVALVVSLGVLVRRRGS